MRAWKEGLDFHQQVLADKEITGRVPPKQIEYAFDLQRQLKNVDKIFARVFGNRPQNSKNPPKPSKAARASGRRR
jgi:adenylosuccinate lyase